MEHGGTATGGAPDLASLASGLLGGGGGLAALAGMMGGGAATPAAGAAPAGGGLGAMLGGLMGGAGGAAPGAGVAAGPMAMLVTPVSQFVAQKTGLAPAMAHTVVTAALPRLLAFFMGAKDAAPGAAAAPSPAANPAGDLLSSLFR